MMRFSMSLSLARYGAKIFEIFVVGCVASEKRPFWIALCLLLRWGKTGRFEGLSVIHA